jgi:Secretion system C-terminal sorting domain
MKYLLNIFLIIGVVLIGFQNSYSSVDEKDKKPISTDSVPQHENKKDTVLRIDEIEVEDTMVFDDFDEDDEEGIIAKSSSNMKESKVASNNLDNHQIIMFFSGEFADTLGQMPVETIEPSKDIATNQFPHEMTIYPNPANSETGTIHIKHNLAVEVSVSIIDQSGRLINSWKSSDSFLTFDKPVSGIYYVTIASKDERLTSRLMVR